METSRRLLGPEHPVTLGVLARFAFQCQREGNYQAAERLAAQLLEGNRHTLGPTHPETIASAADLALAYLSQHKFTEAEPLARQAVDFYRKELPDDWQRFRAETLLAAAWAGEKKFGEAEPLLLEGDQGMTDRKDRIAVPDRYHLERAREWLIQLYLDWGKPGKAVEWRTKAAGRSGQPFIAPAAR